MGTRHELDGQMRDDVPLLAEIVGKAADVRLSVAEDLQEPARRFQHVLVCREAAAGGQGGVHRAQRRVAGVILARQLSVPIDKPPIVVAASRMACAICSSVSPRSLAAATTPPKATMTEA